MRAADLGEVGSEKRVKIKTVTKETDVGEKRKPRCACGSPTSTRGLLLNKTNLRDLQGAFGDVMEAWSGKIVVLYADHGRLPRQNGPRHAGADSAAEGSPQGTVSPPKPTPKPPVDEEVDGFDDPEQLDDDISDVA